MTRAVLISCIMLILGALTPVWAGPQPLVRISLLLLAIDAGRDHVRISEAFRVTSTRDLTQVRTRIILPPQAQYVTVHRGFVSSTQTGDGFTGLIRLRGPITEVAYSYALPTGSREVIARVFPFDVDRMEVVGRGRHVRLAVMRGRELSPVVVGNETLPRWEIRGVPAGERVVIGLTGLPVTSRWWPSAAAAGLAGILMVGLLKGVTSAPQKS
jgi:hypothetical protein